MEPTHHTVHVESGVTLSCETQTVQVSDRVFAFQQTFSTDVQGRPSRFALNVGLPLPPTCFGFLDSSDLDKLFHHQPFDRLDWVVVSNEELHAYHYSHDGLGVSEKDLRKRNPVEWSRAIQNHPNSPHVGIREQLIKLDVLGLNATKCQPVSAG